MNLQNNSCDVLNSLWAKKQIKVKKKKSHDMLETWQSLLLILTNLVLWIPILWTLWHGHFVDATVFFLLFLASTLYHVCQGDKDMCVSSLWETQASDHVWVMAVAGAFLLCNMCIFTIIFYYEKNRLVDSHVLGFQSRCSILFVSVHAIPSRY